MIKKFLIAVVVLATVASIAMAGCASTTSMPQLTSPASKVNDYANNYVTYYKAHSAPDEIFVSSKIVQNGTDAVQVTIVTKKSFSEQTTSNNIRQFSSVSDATAFYNNNSFGYTPATATELQNLTSAGNPYKQTMGHDASRIVSETKYNTVSDMQMTASRMFQQDEFVVWGDISAVRTSDSSATAPANSGSQSSPIIYVSFPNATVAPASTTKDTTPTATPAPTATPTAMPTATPTAMPTATPTAMPTATPTAMPTPVA